MSRRGKARVVRRRKWKRPVGPVQPHSSTSRVPASRASKTRFAFGTRAVRKKMAVKTASVDVCRSLILDSRPLQLSDLNTNLERILFQVNLYTRRRSDILKLLFRAGDDPLQRATRFSVVIFDM